MCGRRVGWLYASEQRAHGVSVTLRPQRGRPPIEGLGIRFSSGEKQYGRQVGDNGTVGWFRWC
jgi:hypothetical protein